LNPNEVKRIPQAYWLASYPKSGNTWVRMFLESYAVGSLDLHKMQFVRGDNDQYYWQSLSPYPTNQCGNDLLLLLRSAVLTHLVANSPFRPVIVKTHFVNAALEGLPAFPSLLTAGSVYLIRDPRDVVISFARHLGMSIDEIIPRMNAHDYHLQDETGSFATLGTWSEHVKTWQDSCVVRYEDLLEDPEKWFAEILRGFNLKVKIPRLRKAIRLCDFDRMKKQDKSKKFRETSRHADTFFHHGTSGHWKDILSPDQAQRIENDHREVMEQYGYLKSNIVSNLNVA